MRRVLFTIPFGEGLPVFGYGLLLMLGFVSGLLLAIFRARKAGLPKNAVLDVGLIAIAAGVIGARLAFLLIDYQPTDGGYGNWREWVAVWQGGLTVQGGVALALLAAWIYLRWKNIPVGKMLDVYAPSLALGMGFGRIGCLMNGCCWGKPASAGSFLAMYFPDTAESMVKQHWLYQSRPDAWKALVTSLGYPVETMPPIPVYATQVVSAVGLFAIFAFLMWGEKRWKNRSEGMVFVWFLFVYGIGRFLVEFWREDTPLRYGFGSFPGLRLGQWLAVIMVAAGIVLYWRFNRRREKLDER